MTIVERVRSAIRAKAGFSLIRLGNSEGVVMWWPDRQSPNDLATAYQICFGHSDFVDSDMASIAEGVRQATRSADVLGLSTRFQMTLTPCYGMVLDAIDYYGLHSASQALTDSVVHWYLQWSGALAYLLRGLDTVFVIGCRDIGADIAETFLVKSVKTFLVRGEARFPGLESRPHWPDGFAEIMQRLDGVRPGDVFLVGAGFLGKIYCARIKAKGGIALDVGSILDSWANIPSRQRYENRSRDFTLDHLKMVGNDKNTMLATLDRCVKEHHARDTTVTYR